jgi:ATP-dependent Clp protease, protease subunit
MTAVYPIRPPERPALPTPQPSPGASRFLAATELDPTVERLLDERIVLLQGHLDDTAADRAVAALLLLAAQDARRDITCYLTSTSGTAGAAVAVHDAMATVAPDVATWALGLVAGPAQFLLTAGAPGKRHATAHSRIRIGRIDPGRHAPADLPAELAALTAHYAGRTPEALAEATGRWFTAAEAQAFGLLDEISPTR